MWTCLYAVILVLACYKVSRGLDLVLRCLSFLLYFFFIITLIYFFRSVVFSLLAHALCQLAAVNYPLHLYRLSFMHCVIKLPESTIKRLVGVLFNKRQT